MNIFKPKPVIFLDILIWHLRLFYGKALTRIHNETTRAILTLSMNGSGILFELSDEEIVPTFESIVGLGHITLDFSIINELLCSGREPSKGFFLVEVFEGGGRFQHLIVVNENVLEGTVDF